MTAKPLDLAQFEGHTPGPWRFNERTKSVVSNQSHPIAELSDEYHRQVENLGTGNDGPLLAAGPALLAECKRQREQIKALTETLDKAAQLRPILLKQFGFVPESVLWFCNTVRDVLAKVGR